jgi:hypothetical protein
MEFGTKVTQELSPGTREFYRHAMEVLADAGVPFLIGGAYALEHYTGIVRHTKDLDVFVRPFDSQRSLQALAAAGYHTELTFPHWLGKAFHAGDLIDVIFCSGNGLAAVDDSWFEHAERGSLLNVAVRLCPVEEMIWQKAYVAERERYDGADVAHLLHARGQAVDWTRLLRRFGEHWRLLLGHLILFGFIYPGEQWKIPSRVVCELLSRLESELSSPREAGRICQGTLLSRAQYLVDIERWGYRDARIVPQGAMTEQQVAHWTAAIDYEKM